MNDKKRFWPIKSFIVWHLFGFILLMSWLHPETKYYWDQFDISLFYQLNGELLGSKVSQCFWAVANTRLFDLFIAIFMFMSFVYPNGNYQGRKRWEHLCYFVLLFAVLFVIRTIFRHTVELERLSPSNILAPFVSLEGYLGWAEVKVSSGNSFPGDHSSLLMLWVAYIFTTNQVKTGLLALLIAFVGILPRLVGGAHWGSDVVVGGFFMMSLTMAWGVYSPLRILLQTLAHFLTSFYESIICTLMKNR